ncbi:NAD dependent epimerase/dehydratase [Colletotrichum salicis]|uniref:NAD dependent epimerase/dehydratase n=1 Tax=Colletotrichum salicis TaxID=1209931 RepID=A0A135UG28_9PEZI|nr:NAD dependent epimerase/dehydratase [Colletotrichum salicis]
MKGQASAFTYIEVQASVTAPAIRELHSVVTSVRNQAKADAVKQSYPGIGADRLSFAIVPDVAKSDAFADAVKSDPPFEAVIHTASPFHFNVTDIKADLLDPAINGTTGILQEIKQNAPSVKRVVITLSFGSMMDVSKGPWPGHTYDESDWNPIAMGQALHSPGAGYSASKKFAEKAAWDFLANESPAFSISTILPPPRAAKKEIPPTQNPSFADVRDVAFDHVAAMEKAEAGNKRFFITNGYCSNHEIIDIIRKHFPEYKSALPSRCTKGGELPKEVYQTITTRSVEILGMKYTGFESCIVDTIRSFSSIKQ